MAVETGIETRYSSSQSTVLGWVQVVTGSVVIIAGIVALSTYKGDIIVADLFTGLLVSLPRRKNVTNLHNCVIKYCNCCVKIFNNTRPLICLQVGT